LKHIWPIPLKNIDWLVSHMETQCVYSEVGATLLQNTMRNLSLKVTNSKIFNVWWDSRNV